jgi:molybdate transport system substrate-binding protein
LETRPAGGVLAVAEGKATLGIALMSEIAADSQVELVGPLPDDLQTYVVFGAGMASGTKKPQGCRAFIAFLGTREVGRTLKKLGMETGR